MKKVVLFNLLLIIIITLYNFSLRYIIYSGFDVLNSSLLIGYQNKAIIHFWQSSLGETLKLLFNTYLVTLLIYLNIYFLEQQKCSYKNIFLIVVSCQLVFILQMFAEFLFYFKNRMLIKSTSSISILSISSLFNKFRIPIPEFLNYSFNTINIFEILFIIFLIYKIKQKYNFKIKTAFRIVALGYIFPLTIWLLIITIISI